MVTAVLIGAGALILGASVLGLRVNLQRRLNRGTSGLENNDRERVEALRQISREIDRGRGAGKGFY